MSKKSRRGDKRLAWITTELLANFKHKKEIYEMWEKEQVTLEDYRNIIRVCRDVTRKTNAHFQLSLSNDIKDNQKKQNVLLEVH